MTKSIIIIIIITIIIIIIIIIIILLLQSLFYIRDGACVLAALRFLLPVYISFQLPVYIMNLLRTKCISLEREKVRFPYCRKSQVNGTKKLKLQHKVAAKLPFRRVQ